ALVAVGALAGTPLPPVNYEAIPWAIYCHPEIAYLGLTEAQAADRGIAVTVKKDPIGGNSRAQIMGESEGFAKVICATREDGRPGRVLGVHLVGPWATEQLSGPSLAINLGLDVQDLAMFLAPHPSLSETYGETLLALTGRGLHVH
ncbi:MAG: dihydrolipoyl dehydrogenase, partial [Actinomycetota bacterium]